MARAEKTDRALADLDEIWFHIALDNIGAADSFLNKLLDKCESIAAFPYSGTDRSDLAPEMRSFCIGHHVIFYKPLAEGILILRVLHGARDIEALLDEGETL